VSPSHLLLLAAGLGSDAFAVSVTEGIVLDQVTHRHVLRLSVLFGLCQGAMPVLGWRLGRGLQPIIGPVDHWVAFGLLALVGVKMALDAALGFETRVPPHGSRGWRLVALGLVTSIDALAVGVTLAMLGTRIWAPALVIGLVTAAMCAFGMHAGDRIGSRLGRSAEILGGVILVGLGVKILLEHLL
jgi:putative Mn2+ efflux pump MntP